MVKTPRTEKPSFEADADELPKDLDNGSADALEDDPQSENGSRRAMDEA